MAFFAVKVVVVEGQVVEVVSGGHEDPEQTGADEGIGRVAVDDPVAVTALIILRRKVQRRQQGEQQ
jgi:hypothetical protein